MVSRSPGERQVSTIRGVGLGVGILGGIIALYALLGLRNELEDAQGFAAVGIGPYVALAGCVVMGIGALKARSPRAS